MTKIITKNYKETQKLGDKLAITVVKNRRSSKSYYSKATVILLYGDLGGGKTTFLQGFAKGLGVKEKVLSPTFVIMKKFSMPSLRGALSLSKRDEAISTMENKTNFEIATPSPTGSARNDRTLYFYHIDAYRMQNYKDAKELGLQEILKNPDNIVAIEWPERIAKILPKNAIKIKFKFVSEKEREIILENQ